MSNDIANTLRQTANEMRTEGGDFLTAVANWLDHEADGAASLAALLVEHSGPQTSNRPLTPMFADALDVANAYIAEMAR